MTSDAPQTILVVEDEESLAELLRVNLQAAGYRVLVATDGLAGLDLFRSAQPDLVTLDLKLPEVSGFRLIKLFKETSNRPVPVVVLSALDYAEAEDAIRSGADDFLRKPFDFADLIARLRYLLDERPPNARV